MSGKHSTRPIRAFFCPTQVKRALERYGAFAQSNAWRIDSKLALYRRAEIAFGSGTSSDVAREAFNVLYAELRGNWQVFRGATAKWPSDQVFGVLSGLSARTRQINLTSIAQNRNLDEIAKVLFEVRQIKSVRRGGAVSMAISKFLHFYNPRLFPIYDTAVIENKVLRTFCKDWNGFDRQFGCSELHFPTAHYLRYICWMSDLITPHSEAIMPIFCDWLYVHTNRFGFWDQMPQYLGNYFATAAEMIAIGAMLVVRDENLAPP